MDKRIMLAWLQGQAQKAELTTTRMQQKRLGIKENTEIQPQTIVTTYYPDRKDGKIGLRNNYDYEMNVVTGKRSIDWGPSPGSLSRGGDNIQLATGTPYLGWDPEKMSVNPDILTKFEDSRAKRRKELYKIGKDESGNYYNPQKGYNEYMMQKGAKYYTDKMSLGSRKPKRISIMNNPVQAGREEADANFEREMIGVDATLSRPKPQP